MENDVQHLIDLLYDMIDNAKGVPLGNDKCIIERNRALDYLDEIRAQLPAELEEAKTDGCPGRIWANAKKEAENLRQRAQNDAKHIVSESETLQTARQQANDIVRKAEERTREMYRVANEYTEDALKRTEDALQAALEEVRASHRQYTDLSRSRMQEAIRVRVRRIPLLQKKSKEKYNVAAPAVFHKRRVFCMLQKRSKCDKIKP